MSYKLLVTDLDGTLLDPSGNIHLRDREAIAALQRKGVGFSIVTGRLYSGTREVALSLDVSGPIACIDGSHIVSVEDDRDLLFHTVQNEGATLLRRLLAELRPATFVLPRDHVCYDDSGSKYLPYLTTWSRCVRRVEDVLDAQHWTGDCAPAAIVSLGEQAEIRILQARIDDSVREHLQVRTFSLRPAGLGRLWGMVIRAAGPSKGTAVEWIARHRGITRSEVVAVGDWLNDIPMLRAAGRSFAMPQAPHEVKEAATDRLEADVLVGGGVAAAAERAGLL